jgi:hypothetical protein
MFIASIVTPVVFGAHSDYVDVTFTPSGDISIEVNKSTASFGTVTTGQGDHTPTEGSSTLTYAIFNNGSVAAHCYIDANATTNTTLWDLDDDGSPPVDNYSIIVENNTGGTQYFSDTNKSWIGSLAGGGGSNSFGLILAVGNSSGSGVLTPQKTRINFTGAIA